VSTAAHLGQFVRAPAGPDFRLDHRDPTFAASTISRGESGTTRPRCHIRVRVRLQTLDMFLTVSLKHDGTDGPVKMANLPVPSVCDRRDRQTTAET